MAGHIKLMFAEFRGNPIGIGGRVIECTRDSCTARA
jgi:hypothetical protein